MQEDSRNEECHDERELGWCDREHRGPLKCGWQRKGLFEEIAFKLR